MPAIILALAFIHNLAISWRKWGDAIFDCGRDLDIARMLAEGQRIYSDTRYMYGPLAPWINCILMKLFGVHADTLIAAGIFTAALCCWAIYTLGRCFMGRIGATLAAGSFLYMFAFAHLTPNGTFNFALPYTSSATYGITFAILSVLGLVRFIRNERRLPLVLSLIFFALTALTKVELFLAVAVPHLVFLILRLIERRSADFRLWGAYALACIAIVGAYLFAARDAGIAYVWREELFPLVASAWGFSSFHMGLQDPAGSALNMLKSLAIAAVTLAGAFALARVVSPSGPQRAMVTAAAVALGFGVYYFLPISVIFLLATPVAAIALLVCVRRCLLKMDPDRAFLLQAVLWSFALGCMPRMLFKPISYHYGFYLFPPMALALIVGLLAILPRLASKSREGRGVIFGAGAGMVLASVVTHFNLSSSAYAMHTVEMNAPRANLWLYNPPGPLPQGQLYAGAVRLLAAMPPHTRVLVVPQGVSLAFFSGQDNPYGMYGYNLPELTGAYSDGAIVAMLERDPPDLVVRTATDTMEFGNQYFGKDYGTKFWNWITTRYEPCMSVGPSGFLTIYRRPDVNIAPLLTAAGNPSAPAGKK